MTARSEAEFTELERESASLRRLLAENKSAYAERIDHQDAATDVLKAMSASPGDPQPVFELICSRARQLMDVQNVGLFEFDGTRVHYRADSGSADLLDARSYEEYFAAWPLVPTRSSMTCRAILDGKIIHVPDLEIRVRDNGTGISHDIREKLFQPFFTTKPTGEGTGLGLSITYDIVTKQHGGTIVVESVVDDFTEFTVTLPRQMFAAGGVEA